MRDLIIAQFKPFSQFLVLMLIIALTGSLVTYAGIELVKMLYGFDIAQDVTVLSNMEAPFVIEANRVFLITQHLGFFIFPALVFSHFMRTAKFGNYLFWEMPKPSKFWVLGIIGFLLALPFVNFTAFINEGLKLPAAMKDAQQLLEASEEQAKLFVEGLLSLPGSGQTIFNLIALALIPAIGEELIFRGCIQRILSRSMASVHLPIWITAILFSLLHFQFFGFVPRILLGAFLGYLFLYSKNIWLPIIAHFLNNAIAVLGTKMLLASNEKSWLDNLGYGFDLSNVLIALSTGALSFYLLFKLSKVNSKNWDEQYKWEILKLRTEIEDVETIDSE